MDSYEKRVADRLVGFDPISILSIIGTIASIVSACWSVSYGSSNAAVSATRAMSPRRAIKRLRRLIKRKYPDMHEAQQKKLAEAMYLELDDEDVAPAMARAQSVVLDPEDLNALESDE